MEWDGIIRDTLTVPFGLGLNFRQINGIYLGIRHELDSVDTVGNPKLQNWFEAIRGFLTDTLFLNRAYPMLHPLTKPQVESILTCGWTEFHPSE